MKRCFVCHGTTKVSEMTDGLSSHLVCDDCRPLVNIMFMLHKTLGVAVLEAAQTLRGSKE
jgi:hypothetical protein